MHSHVYGDVVDSFTAPAHAAGCADCEPEARGQGVLVQRRWERLPRCDECMYMWNSAFENVYDDDRMSHGRGYEDVVL